MIEHHSWLADTVHDRNGVAGNGLDEEFASEDFDFEKVFRSLDGEKRAAARDRLADLGELFRERLNWVFQSPCGRRWTMRRAFLRFTCLTAALHPEMFANRSYQELGAELGVTKQCLSRLVGQLQKRYGIQFARSRSAVGRQHMSTAQKKNSHWKK